jgi:uncharacterized protein
MPQLKKIVLVVGSRLIYADSYEQALAQLSTGAQKLVQQASAPAAVPAAPSAAQAAGGATADKRLESIRNHLRRYRDLASQGRWAEAGKELEAIEQEAK